VNLVDGLAGNSELAPNVRDEFGVAVNITEGTVKLDKVPILKSTDAGRQRPSSRHLSSAECSEELHGVGIDRSSHSNLMEDSCSHTTVTQASQSNREREGAKHMAKHNEAESVIAVQGRGIRSVVCADGTGDNRKGRVGCADMIKHILQAMERLIRARVHLVRRRGTWAEIARDDQGIKPWVPS
jgi:hypothetical protein